MHYSTHLLRHIRFKIGKNIETLRIRYQLSLAELAQSTDVPEKALQYYEAGKGEIQLGELVRLACKLNVQPHELMQ